MRKLLIPTIVLLVLSTTYAIPPGVDVHREPTLFPCATVRYSTPIKVSATLGVVILNPIGSSQYIGPFFQLEPGFGGGKISAGFRYGKMQFIPLYNVGLAASLLYTWGDPLQGVERENTYFGLELSGGAFMIGINGGVFYHVGGDDQDSDWIYSLGVGVGI